MKSENNSSIRILLVDDEEIILKSLTRLLEKKYNIITALSGTKALELLNSKGMDVAVIISDQRMPEMAGVEFLKESIKIKPNAIRIILTGYTDLNDIIKAINEAKLYKFLLKPIDPSSFLLEIKRAVEVYEKEVENAKAITSLTLNKETLENKIKQLTEDGNDNFLSYEELQKSLVITPTLYFEAISENLQELEDSDQFIRNKSRLLRFAKEGKNFITISKKLSTNEKFSNDFWKLEDIITEAIGILVEWKKKKYIKIISNISPALKIYGNKTLLRDIIFVHAFIYYAENFIIGDTIYIDSESFEDKFCTIILSSSKKIDIEKIEDIVLSKETLLDSTFKNKDLYFLHKLLSIMKGSIIFSEMKGGKAKFIAITLKVGK